MCFGEAVGEEPYTGVLTGEEFCDLTGEVPRLGLVGEVLRLGEARGEVLCLGDLKGDELRLLLLCGEDGCGGVS